MITQTLSRHRRPALTSDQWHIVHARWIEDTSDEPRFERAIVSEHADLESAKEAAKGYASRLSSQMLKREVGVRDQVILRHPNFVSLKVARKWARRTPGAVSRRPKAPESTGLGGPQA